MFLLSLSSFLPQFLCVLLHTIQSEELKKSCFGGLWSLLLHHLLAIDKAAENNRMDVVKVLEEARKFRRRETF